MVTGGRLIYPPLNKVLAWAGLAAVVGVIALFRYIGKSWEKIGPWRKVLVSAPALLAPVLLVGPFLPLLLVYAGVRAYLSPSRRGSRGGSSRGSSQLGSWREGDLVREDERALYDPDGTPIRGGRTTLRVRGRMFGVWRETAVNLLTIDEDHYLVAPLDEPWAYKLRSSRRGELRVGCNIQLFTAEEIGEDDKASVLRAYLRLWRLEVRPWPAPLVLRGIGPNSSEADLRAEAAFHPVFRLHMTV